MFSQRNQNNLKVNCKSHFNAHLIKLCVSPLHKPRCVSAALQETSITAEKENPHVGCKLASLISSVIDCEKFEDDILRKPSGQSVV